MPGTQAFGPALFRYFRGMRLFLLLAAGLLLASCGNLVDSLDQSEIPGYTKEWVREQDGQVLTFRNAAGQTHQLRVARSEGVHSTNTKAGPANYAYLNVRYGHPTDSLLTFQLQTSANEIQVLRHGRGTGAIHTYQANGRTAFYSTKPDLSSATLRIVTQDTVLGGRKHRYLGSVRVLPASYSADTLTHIYFSRYEGVVGFATARAGLWLRK